MEGSGGPGPTVDLNGFYIHVFAWYSKHSGEEAYMNIAEQAFATLSKHPDGRQGPWLSGDKQFNETFQKAWQFAAYAP